MQKTAEQYCGVVFHHEGWPLCLHEKVVVQLCPLDQQLLQPGDFYLLVSPLSATRPPSQSHSIYCRDVVSSRPRLLLCSTSASGHHVEQQEVSEIGLHSIFSMAWLNSVNRERQHRGAPRLERCLLSAHGNVFRVPWEDLVYPQLISQPHISMKEDKDSSTKGVVIKTSHDPCRELESSTHDIKLPPSSPRNDQSPASSGGDDSEGDYVELTNAPLPRFSPQKGSLTQSISLQLRARTSTCTPSATHTTTQAPQAVTHISTHRLQNTPAAAHSPTVTCGTTTSSVICPETCDRWLNQEPHAPVNLTSPCCPSAPEAVGGSRSHKEMSISEDPTGGTSFCSNPVNCTDQREEQEEVESKGKSKEGEEGQVMERQKGKCEMLELDGEEEEEEQECQRGEDLLLQTLTTQEEQNTCEGTENSKEEEDGAEHVEVEEEVQVIILHHSHDKRQLEEVMKGDEGGGEGGGGQTFTDQEVDSCASMHCEDFYSELNSLQKHSEGSYCENTSQTHAGDSFCEKNTEHTQFEDSFCEKNTEHTQFEDSFCEKNTEHTQFEDSFCEKNTEQTQFEDSYCKTKTDHTHSNGSYCENTEQTHSEGSYCEKNTAVQVPLSVWTEVEASENGQKIEKKKEEEEVGGGGAAEPHVEAAARTHVSLSTGLSPTKLELPAAESNQSSFYHVLLRSGVVCLPGSRDRSGRALLTICTRSNVWSSPNCDHTELLRLLLYYSSILRDEVRALGLTVLVDARGASPVPVLFKAFRALQDNTPGSVHCMLLLVNKDSKLPLHKSAAIQVEVLHSLESLHKQVDLQQVPTHLGGSLNFSQNSWLCFRLRVEQLSDQCESVIKLLQKPIAILQATSLPSVAQDAELLLSRYREEMRGILEDSCLVQLQQEGGASLSWLRSVSMTEEEQVAVETVSALYDQVDEMLHRLVTLSNCRTQELSFILDFSRLEQGFSKVMSWLQQVGEVRLKVLEEPEDSLELLNEKQQDFKEFYATAYEHCSHGEELLRSLEPWSDLSSADLQVYKLRVHSFGTCLRDFSERVKTTGQNIKRAVHLYRFLDQAYGWALEGMRRLAGISMEECTLPEKSQAMIDCLEEYCHHHPPIPDSRFQEMKVEAEELRGDQGLCQWSFAWSKCQETKKVFDRKMEAALRTRDCAHRQRSDSTHRRSSVSVRKTLSGLWGGPATPSSSSCSLLEEDTNTSTKPHNSSSTLHPSTSTPAPMPSPITPQRTPFLQRLFRSSSIEQRVDVGSSSPSLPHSITSCSSSRRQQLRKTQSFDCPSTHEQLRYGPCARALSEPVRRGNTGVFIRGLEVSSTEAADCTRCPRTAAQGWSGQGIRSPSTPSTSRTTSSPTEPRPRGSKLRHIVEEMVTTEREYVRSLQYIIHHYFPEMERADLPQDLRGKRSVVFGNLEKLLDFHSQFFLKELEACWKHPLRVPHCFLRHQEQFSLYALYSKNKPKSDSLLVSHGTAFFRKKQIELRDKMDLSSYLLKPIQRMSKYALLLTDLMKQVGTTQEAELAALQAATNMVKFQLRHGNDLLAMDAIRDCDVNLKEQGQLIRQDEFAVWTGRRKCQRHVFLFDELILFSKPKKMEGGLDVFIYKQSFKTADVGLTESAGDSGLCFEIWFRRRRSKSHTFILQAATEGVKSTWTADIARILWAQATRNKELRLKEMVSMGVGNKPFLDIQPSDAAISDRAVHHIVKSRGARTRASIAVSAFDHSNPFKRGAVSSNSAPSGWSSSSLLGPLNLHLYSQMVSSTPAESSFITSFIEEDEQEHETSSQPSMTTESSGSSSRCLSGSTGSDSGCVSSHLQEALQDDLSQHLSSQYISSKVAPVIGPASIV